jgi:hypothetical protein
MYLCAQYRPARFVNRNLNVMVPNIRQSAEYLHISTTRAASLNFLYLRAVEFHAVRM